MFENDNLSSLMSVRQRDLQYRSGPKIKKFRKAMGLTQEQLAIRVGVTRSSVANWEACLRAPSIEHYCILAKELKVNINSLY